MLNTHRLPAAITHHVVYPNPKLTSSRVHLHIAFHLMGASELDTVVSVSAVALAPTDRSKQYPRQSLQRLSFHPAFFNLQPVGQLGSTSRIHTVCERESHTLGLFFFLSSQPSCSSLWDINPFCFWCLCISGFHRSLALTCFHTGRIRGVNSTFGTNAFQLICEYYGRISFIPL